MGVTRDGQKEDGIYRETHEYQVWFGVNFEKAHSSSIFGNQTPVHFRAGLFDVLNIGFKADVVILIPKYIHSSTYEYK